MNEKTIVVSWLLSLTILVGFLAYSRTTASDQKIANREVEQVVIERCPVMVTEMYPVYYYAPYPHDHHRCCKMKKHPRHATYFRFSIGGPL